MTLLPSLSRKKGKDDTAHALHPSGFRACLREGHRFHALVGAVFRPEDCQALSVWHDSLLLKLAPSAGEMGNGVSWDWKAKVGELKKGCFKCFTFLMSSMCITYHCLPEHIRVSRAVIALLYFEFTPLFGRCSHRRPSLLMSRYLTAWEGFYRVWQMQKPWITCYSYGVWVFHVQVIVICPPFF